MPFAAPFKMGPFIVDADGGLSPSAPEPAPAPAFLFRWRDRVVRARLVVAADQAEGRLVLQATLGRVPSTASTPEGALRPRSFALLHWLPRSVPPGWRVRLLADHRVVLEAEPPLTFPTKAAALLTEITCFVLGLSPYLDLLEEAGVSGTTADSPIVHG